MSEYKTAVRFVQSTWIVPLDGQTLDTALTANKILNSPCPTMADDSSFQLETLGSTLTDVIATSGLNRETSRLLGLQLLTPRPSQMHASALHIVGVAGQGLDCYRLTEILDSCSPGTCQYVSADRISVSKLFGEPDAAEKGYLLDPIVDTTVIELTTDTDTKILSALAQAMRSQTYAEYQIPGIDTHALESRIVCIYRSQSVDPSVSTLLSEALYPFVGAADLFCSFGTSPDTPLDSSLATNPPADTERNTETGSPNIASTVSAQRTHTLGFSEEARQQLCQYWTTISDPQTAPAIQFNKGGQFQSEAKLIERSLRDSIKSLSTASARSTGKEQVQKEDIYNAIEVINYCRSFCDIEVSEVAFWIQHTDQAADRDIKLTRGINSILQEASPKPVSFEKLRKQCLNAGYMPEDFEKAITKLEQQGTIHKSAEGEYQIVG